MEHTENTTGQPQEGENLAQTNEQAAAGTEAQPTGESLSNEQEPTKEAVSEPVKASEEELAQAPTTDPPAGAVSVSDPVSAAPAVRPTPSEPEMVIELAAQNAHEVNRAYCQAIGDDSQLPWSEAPAWQKESAIAGVRFRGANPNATPADMHASWLAQKEADGWKYGPVKDVEKKEHPCMLPYDQLPTEQKVKDYLFSAVVAATMRDYSAFRVLVRHESRSELYHDLKAGARGNELIYLERAERSVKRS